MTQSVTASISKGPDSVIYSRNSHNATKILSFKWTRDTGQTASWMPAIIETDLEHN